MLLNVLTRVAGDTGFDPVQQRSALINILYDAAKELYNMLECNKIYRETTLIVPPDSVVALPNFIGELRGMRMHTNELPFDLNAISSPRYVNTTLQFKFKNWRDLGDSVTHTLPALVGPLTLEMQEPDNSEVIISGQTNVAAKVEETIVMNDTVVSTVNMFGPQLFTIACTTPRDCNIIIKDADGNELATLFNNEQKTRYKLVDVSQIFWTLDTAEGKSLIDVCYKVPLTRMTRDTDSFPGGDDYDNAWYYMSMFTYLTNLQGRGDEASAARAAAIAACISAKDGGEQEVMKKLAFGRNKFFGLFRKYRYFPGSVTSVDHNIQS